ncbi:hypothetical protein, partial [Actinoplanes sp. NPDC051411]|uniref:hypothetical protein n=1 Tax=Actinoplanes sp. NPDC051411 TaxID=3155522 RepID=UPI003428F2A7
MDPVVILLVLAMAALFLLLGKHRRTPRPADAGRLRGPVAGRLDGPVAGRLDEPVAALAGRLDDPEPATPGAPVAAG